MTEAVLRNSVPPEPGRVPAGVLAVLVHIIFFALMIFGLNWKTYPPEGMVVDLWSSLPQPEVPVQPTIKEAPKPAPPPPEPKPVPKAETPPPAKPDIALKEKIEKPKPVEKEKPKPVEKKPPEKQKPAEKEHKEQKDQLKEQKTRVADEIEQIQRQQEANDRLQAQAAAQSRLMNEIAEYKARILAKIRRNIVMPPDLPGNPVVEFNVTLLPGGDILDVKLSRSSGFAAFDSAVERGIYLSKPLPLPPDPAMFPQFRNLSVKVHYHE
ncbi:TonB C-terminal domain-containing protein [Nitrosovibrio tenuis]|uniref:Cell division and transport-associated protein TolA n=1 Tax=Nitrosovibrio tenuis TaxID=1233 RepID=A0A1H7LI05_9PROT|nr:TonB C-terminal domain-containing protein [Nitrosovibrio tenuis]SEK98017.1 Cell division and transport-associated protein TolA [Nitrosovibrio tenuis]